VTGYYDHVEHGGVVARRQVAGRRLGALEAEVMELAWRRGDWIGVNDVLAALRGERRAYTTVMTIVTRLCDKGLLERRREGRGFVYRPALSKEALAARALREVLAAADDPQAVLTHFVKDLEAAPELLARLHALAGGASTGADDAGGGGRR
jgi:predicted transcriptional regulator